MAPRFPWLAALVALTLLTVPAGAAAQSDDESPGLLAPSFTCPGQTRTEAPGRALVNTMRCLVNFARAEFGLEALDLAPTLARSSMRKARDVLRCQDFSHFACGRDFKHWMQRTGYISTTCWRVGENLAWGSGAFGTARSIFRAWLRSESHRENVLGDFEEFGVGVRSGRLEGHSGVRVWAQHFGALCSAPASP